MKRLFIIITWLILTCVTALGQTRKTVKDTIFNKGDIIKIPYIEFNGDGWIIEKPYQINPSDPHRFPPEYYVDYTDSLKIIGDFINSHKNFILEIGAFTDCRGTEKFSVLLSEFRAHRIYDYVFYKCGVDTSQIKYKGYGNSQPLVPCKKILNTADKVKREKLYSINRRYQLKVLEIK